MSHEEAVRLVRDYMNDIRPPEHNWPAYWFKNHSYSVWVCEEILNKLEENPHVNPIDIIEKFVCELDYYSTLSKTSEFRMIFSIARDIAEDIGRMFL